MTTSRLVALAALLLARPVFAQGEPTPPAPPTPPVAPSEPPVPPAPPAPPTPTEPPAPVPPAPLPAPATPAPVPDDTAPLQFKIGSAYFTPLGFMDFTGVWRSKNGGSGIGTNFGSIPYGVVPGNYLNETRLSMQNSRVGFRIDAPVHGAHVIGYMEADFLGNNPGNVAVSSNSNTLRSRVYWVDLRKHEWEVLAGQTWSLITPSRAGISPIPGSLFITQNIDVNYQAGLVWGRMPELRVVYHPTKMVAAALALDNPEQYIGGSAGGGVPTLPMSLSALAGTQLNNGTTTFGVPNILPDVIAKVAIDPSPKLHVEAGGVERQFRVWNPTNDLKFSATGLGGFLNGSVELYDGLRLVSNNFWSSGGGRYIFGQAPDVVVLADGSLQTVQSGSTVTGIEYTHGPTALAAYYGGIYIGHAEGPSAMGTPCTDAMSCVGYGYAGSPLGQNKTIQELTLDANQTIWKDPKFGALNLMGQYSFLTRDPWSVAAGNATGTHVNMVFLNLRYTLPGAPPKMPD